MLSRRVLIAVAAVLPFAGHARAQAARLNPNTATPAQLAAVPGMPAALAQAIVRQRPFASIVEFNALVRGTLSEEQAKALYPQLFLPVNLNTGTREQILLIPGMTPRMVREFLEYRPYTSMDQFNREIGKYVPPEEVARLRSYVTL